MMQLPQLTQMLLKSVTGSIITAMDQLMKIYRNIPMSLADACLVRMAEIHEHSKVMTLDSDFTVYRKSRRKVIPLLRPVR